VLKQKKTSEETVAEINAVSKYRTRPVCRISTGRLREKNKKILANGVQKL
jgi:2-keto-3-deoxy-L-rhamnonate aldolase RhmA